MGSPPGPILAIAGTDTDAGKTVVAAGLLRAVADLGVPVQALKPVQTGCLLRPDGELFAADAAVCREACPSAVCGNLVGLATPCSPHLAARLEGAVLAAADLARGIRRFAQNGVFTLVEGAGGLLVPLNERETLADVLVLLGVPVLLVAANRLGAINHALLSAEAARARGLDVAGLVLSETTPDRDGLEGQIRRDNMRYLAAAGRFPFVAALPHAAGLSAPDAARRAAAWNAVGLNLRDTARRLLGRAAMPRPGRSAADIARFDAAHLWHPYAPARPPPRVWVAERTAGTGIVLADGRVLVDGMSSWWAAIHGYNHPALLDALRSQAARMPHVMFGGFTHEPAAALGEKLLRLVPEGLERVFFCDSGSVAAEAAIKMAVQFQVASGRSERRLVAAPLGGYHGDTLGAMSVCDPVAGMHGLFRGILPEQVFFDRPSCRFGGEFGEDAMASARDVFARRGRELAAVILEPVVQGAGGMWFYHPEYLRRLRDLCSEHSVPLIFDEIATGFGRTGRMFAAEWAGVTPDILCVGKALTGGVMTLAAVVAREEVAEVVSRNGAFMHGPTFMANPLACAVAEASLDVLTSSPWRERVAGMERLLAEGLEPCRALPGVRDVRVLGGIGVVEMEEAVNTERLQRFFVDECGVWIRPFSRLVYVMPPYVASASELHALTSAITGAVEGGLWK